MGLQALRPEARVQTTPLWDSLGHFHPLSVLSFSCGPKFPCWPPICFPLKPILVPNPLLGFPCLLPLLTASQGDLGQTPLSSRQAHATGRGGRLSGDLCPFPSRAGCPSSCLLYSSELLCVSKYTFCMASSCLLCGSELLRLRCPTTSLLSLSFNCMRNGLCGHGHPVAIHSFIHSFHRGRLDPRELCAFFPSFSLHHRGPKGTHPAVTRQQLREYQAPLSSLL